MPHAKSHVLADVHQGGAAEVERAVDAAGEAWQDWHRLPWEDRAAVFLRAAELLAGPWRDTLNAATMLGQSKTAHQAEIDAACELIDFLRFNVSFMLRIYEEQPISSPGVWNRMEYRPLEGFVFAVTPFNFTAIAGNLPSSAALMGNTVVWKPASTAMASAYYLMRLFEEAGLPPGVINLVYGSGADDRRCRTCQRAPGRHPLHGLDAVFQGMWKTVGENISGYRNYPRVVGETGGKDFIIAHRSADVGERRDRHRSRLVRVSGAEVLRSLAALHAIEPLAGDPRAPRRGSRVDQGGRRLRLHELHGCGHRREVVRHAARGDRGGDEAPAHEGARRWRDRRQRGVFRRADGDRDGRSELQAPARRALRPRGDRIRLSGERVRAGPRAGRLDGTLRTHRGGLRGGASRRSWRQARPSATRPGIST